MFTDNIGMTSDDPISNVTIQTSSAHKPTMTQQLEGLVTPSDHASIIMHQQWIQTLLENYIIIEDAAPTLGQDQHADPMSIDMTQDPKRHPISITIEELGVIRQINDSLTALDTIHKRVRAIPKNLHKKVTETIDSSPDTVWATMTDWIDKSIKRYLNHPHISNAAILQKTNEWIESVQSQCHRQLEKDIKDYLHALVNHRIIQPNKHQSTKWNNQLTNEEIAHNPLIQSIEKTIDTELQQVTAGVDAPFMATFSKELFTRCYKSLLSPKPNDVVTNTINEMTQDLNSTPGKPKWPTDIQDQFDNEYREFLKKIVDHPPNVKKYSKSRFKSLKAMIAHKDLNEKEKKQIQRTYFSIYKHARTYEKRMAALALRNTTVGPSTEAMTRAMCHNIELAHHEYRPFVMAYIQQLQLALQTTNTTERRDYVKDYNDALNTVQRITKTIELSRLINRHFQKNRTLPQLNDHDFLNQYNRSKKSTLNKSIAPWTHYDWQDDLSQLIDTLNIRETPTKAQRVIGPIDDIPIANVSQLIQTPPHDTHQDHPSLNETI